MGRNKTHEDYIQELKEKNPTVEAVENYIDAKTKIKHHCLIHDIYWNISPSNALKGCGCKECRKERISLKNKKTKDQYILELAKANKDVKLIGDYVNANVPTLHRCLVCGREWMARPAGLLFKSGCPSCAKNERRTNQIYIDDLKKKNPFITPLQDYINANTKILHKCLICENEWYVQPSSILHGYGCPECAKKKYW